MLKKIVSSTISQIFWKILTAIISIFLLALLTKYLSPELYGQYNRVYNYLAFFTFFADLGLYTIAVREISKTPKDAGKIVGNILSLRLTLGIFSCLLALGLAFFLPGYHTPLFLGAIGIVSVFSILSLMNSSFLSLMQAHMKMEFSLLSSVVNKLLTFGFIACVAYIWYPVEEHTNFSHAFLAILGAGMIGIFVNTSLNWYYANRITPIRFLWDFPYIKYIFFTSLPYGIALFLSVVYMKIDIIFLSILPLPWNINADIAIALYSVPMKILEVLMVMSWFFLASILPSLTASIQEKKTQNFEKIFSGSFRFLLSFWLLIFVFGKLLWEDILRIVTSNAYLDPSLAGATSFDVLVIVLFGLIFSFLFSLYQYITIAQKKETLLLKINALMTCVNMVWNIIMIPIFWFLWAARVTCVCQILLFVSITLIQKKIPLIREWKYILCIIGISIGIWMLGKNILISFSLWAVWNLIGIWGGLFLVFIGMSWFVHHHIPYK